MVAPYVMRVNQLAIAVNLLIYAHRLRQLKAKGFPESFKKACFASLFKTFWASSQRKAL
jgi:hypothetical protein